ncbi:hypothetical protein [Chryseobacterium sp.]|uniref:hypothetical protein n=1 Tax=Chryseobacterium sp. TaxID=1871047 RepID=UPI001B2E6DD9|nr:hypothetical protein [Chryseobacterium sp.]MBO9691287.1 hypothetical protein [Chryseobacterium sp.]
MKDLLISNRNEELWEKLDEKFNIEIVPNTEKEYSVFTRSENAIIYYDPTNICESSFTHELLHINLKYHEFYISGAMKNNMRSDYLLDRLFPTELIDHIGNVLDHLKMFKLYLKMGYDPAKFIYDYSDKKVDDSVINNIKRNYRIGNKINSNAVHYFAGKLSAIMGDVNSEHNYHDAEIEFQNIDQELYNAFASLFVEVINHDYENADFMYNYRDIAGKFHEQLVDWKNNNEFV